MAQKIVGFFKDRTEAESARDELIEAGFGRNDVSVYQGNGESPGLWEDIKRWFGFADPEEQNLYQEAAKRGSVAVLVDASDDDTPSEERALRILQRHHPMDLDAESKRWSATTAGGTTASVQQPSRSTTTPTTGARPGQAQAGTDRTWAAGSTAPETAGSQRRGMTQKEEVIPVTQESVSVGKRAVIKGGIRVHSRITTKPVEEQVTLRDEHARVERRPTDRPVTEGDQAFKERAVEVTETSEQPVVKKEARVVEEVVVSKDVEQRTETVRDTVRRTDVEVDKLNADNPPTGDARYASDFASEIARDRQYQGVDWASGESRFRQSWEKRYPNSRWDQVKESIRRDYEKARNKV